MSVRRSWSFLALALCTLARPVGAAGLDKDAKKWLDDVRPLMLPEEEKTFRDLKEKSDRDEFQKIFWARRDPDLETAANEYQAEYLQAKATVDTKYKVGSTPGSLTDCGRVVLLLGEPSEVKKSPSEGPAARRGAETWVYKDRPGMKFKDGQAEIALDENCMLPQGGRFTDQLVRVAEGKIAHPNLDYRKGNDGKLVKLADQLPKPTPVMALLKTPRQDFPATTRTTMFLRSPGGASYVAGLARLDAGAVAPEDVGGKKTAKVSVGVQAVDAEGKVVASSDRDASADVMPDGSAVVSYGMALKPGPYTLHIGVLDPKASKGTVAEEKIDVPDFGSDELMLAPLVVLREIAEGAGSAQDAMAAFTLGNTRFIPAFGNVFAPSESVTVVTALYNARTAEATGKPSFTYSFAIQKDGKTVAETEKQTSESPQETPSVGPVPLAKYGTGKFTVRLNVRDNVAQKDYTKDATFEIR